MLQRIERPIFCTQRFKKDVERIYGGISRYEDEASAYAHVIAGSAIFYKCEALPEYMMTRQRASVSTRMDTPEVRKMFVDELQLTQGKCRHVSVHDHPMNFPYLSACDIRTYERCRTSETEPSPFGQGNPYPVILINLSDTEDIELMAFWVYGGRAHRTALTVIPDDSETVSAAWKAAPQLAYFSEEAILARNIGKTLSDGWHVTLGVNAATQRKALLVMAPDGRNQAIPFVSSPLGLGVDDVWKYVDWSRLFEDCLRDAEAENASEPESTETAHTTTGETDEKCDTDNLGSADA